MFNLSETQKAELTTKIVDFFVVNLPYCLILFSFINIHYFYSQNYNIYNDIFVGLTTYITFHIYKQIYLANFREKLVKSETFKKLVEKKYHNKGFLYNIIGGFGSYLVATLLYFILHLNILFFINVLFFFYINLLNYLFYKKFNKTNQENEKK